MSVLEYISKGTGPNGADEIKQVSDLEPLPSSGGSGGGSQSFVDYNEYYIQDTNGFTEQMLLEINQGDVVELYSIVNTSTLSRTYKMFNKTTGIAITATVVAQFVEGSYIAPGYVENFLVDKFNSQQQFPHLFSRIIQGTMSITQSNTGNNQLSIPSGFQGIKYLRFENKDTTAKISIALGSGFGEGIIPNLNTIDNVPTFGQGVVIAPGGVFEKTFEHPVSLNLNFGTDVAPSGANNLGVVLEVVGR